MSEENRHLLLQYVQNPPILSDTHRSNFDSNDLPREAPTDEVKWWSYRCHHLCSWRNTWADAWAHNDLIILKYFSVEYCCVKKETVQKLFYSKGSSSIVYPFWRGKGSTGKTWRLAAPRVLGPVLTRPSSHSCHCDLSPQSCNLSILEANCAAFILE